MTHQPVGAAATALALCTAIVVALTASALIGGGATSFDRSVAWWVATHRTDGLVWAMERATIAGSAAAIWVVAVACAVRGSVRRDWGPLPFIGATALMAWLTTNLLKLVVARQRPPSDIALHPFSGYSFPSGHATTAAALWGATLVVVVRSERCRARTGALLWGALILLVGTSRLVLGAHWLTDVIAGTAVGTAWVAIAVLVSAAAHARSQVHV